MGNSEKSIGHVSGRLFMSDRHGLYFVLPIIKGIQQADNAMSTEPKKLRNFFFYQIFRNNISASHLCHWNFLFSE